MVIYALNSIHLPVLIFRLLLKITVDWIRFKVHLTLFYFLRALLCAIHPTPSGVGSPPTFTNVYNPFDILYLKPISQFLFIFHSLNLLIF